QVIITGFFDQIATLDNTLFNRADVDAPLQNLLSKQLKDLRSISRDGLNTSQNAHVDAMIKIEEARLACRLGVKSKQNTAGATGSRIYLNLQGKKIGIFKPKEEAPLSTMRKIRHTLREWF